jgi:hypothetical protein
MRPLAVKLGYWSAIACFFLVVVYLAAAVTGVAVASSFPPFVWTDLPGFLASTNRAVLVCFTFDQVVMFLLSPVYLVLLCSFHDCAAPGKKPLTRIALHLWTGPLVLTCTLYFLHFHSLRMIFSKGVTTGLEQLVQWNADSAVNVIGTLGWTFFAGLAFVFLALTFSGSRLERRLRLAFLLEGIGCLIGLVGALTQNMALVGIYFMSVIVGGIASSLMAAVLFRRLAAQATSGSLDPSTPRSFILWLSLPQSAS